MILIFLKRLPWQFQAKKQHSVSPGGTKKPRRPKPLKRRKRPRKPPKPNLRRKRRVHRLLQAVPWTWWFPPGRRCFGELKSSGRVPFMDFFCWCVYLGCGKWTPGSRLSKDYSEFVLFFQTQGELFVVRVPLFPKETFWALVIFLGGEDGICFLHFRDRRSCQSNKAANQVRPVSFPKKMKILPLDPNPENGIHVSCILVLCIYLYLLYIWVFPKMVVPPYHPC